MLTIQSVMLVALGFLAAGLLILAVAPAFWSRAVRLTTKRLKEALPVSEDEVRADKDRLRAEFAIRTHKLEMRLEQAELQRARHVIELSRRDASVSALEQQVGAFKSTVDEHQNARLVLEQTVADRLPRVEQRLAEAKTLLFNRDREIADLTQSARSQRLALEEAHAINAQQSAEVERMTNALTMRDYRNQQTMTDPKYEAEVALRAEIEALRGKTREQAALISRLQSPESRLMGTAGGAAAAAAMTTPSLVSNSDARPSPPISNSGNAELEREVRLLKTRTQDQDSEIVRLKAELITFQSTDAEGASGVKDSRIALKARLAAAEAQTGQQGGTIKMLRTELAAANERIALQAAHFTDEMRRLGAGTLPASAPNKRSLANGSGRRSLAERVAQQRPSTAGAEPAGRVVETVAEKTPEEPANVDAGAATASPAAPSDATAPDAGNKGGNGSGGSDVVHLPVPSGNSAATPDTPRLRLFDRISNLNKI